MERITSTKLGLYKHYFPVGIFQENEKEILQVLGQETTREILMLIIKRQAPIHSAQSFRHLCVDFLLINLHLVIHSRHLPYIVSIYSYQISRSE